MLKLSIILQPSRSLFSGVPMEWSSRIHPTGSHEIEQLGLTPYHESIATTATQPKRDACAATQIRATQLRTTHASGCCSRLAMTQSSGHIARLLSAEMFRYSFPSSHAKDESNLTTISIRRHYKP